MKYRNLLNPSALFLITFVIAIVLSWVHPWHVSFIEDKEIQNLSGIIMLLTSLILNILAYKAFKKYLTPHEPFKTPNVLIEKSIFRFSRNPVYLALVLSEFGLGCVFDTVWLLLGSVVLLTLLHYIVVLDEEKVLQSTFKESYELYKEKTPRWI